MEANSGTVDGEAYRVRFDENTQKSFPNLIRVDVALEEVSVAAYSTNPSLRVQGWESLKGKDLLIGYPRGTKTIEMELPKYINEKNRLDISDLRVALKMLAAGRLDVLLGCIQNVESALFGKEFRMLPIKRIGIVHTIQVYPYLHKKHAELVPQLADVLRAMKADGTFDRLLEQAEKQTYGK